MIHALEALVQQFAVRTVETHQQADVGRRRSAGGRLRRPIGFLVRLSQKNAVAPDYGRRVAFVGKRRFGSLLMFAMGFAAGVLALFGVALLSALRNL